MSYSNFHSHTTFCDGTETAEGMTLAAIAKGCRALGFSGHAHTEFEVSMSPADTAAYKAELRRLQAAYAGRIELYLGVEQDYFSDLPTEDYDFVIGSVHTLHMPGGDVFADGDAAHQTEAVMRFYGGDWYAFAEDYYALEARVARVTNCSIVGHFDVLNKSNEGGCLFDTAHPRYRTAAISAMEQILETCRLFEVNTGAMYRVGRTEQYPQTWLLRELLERGGDVILSSDSHDAASLGFQFEEMETLLRAVGFTSRKTLTRDGFADIKL